MTVFTYEEHSGRKYLVYEKKIEDKVDTLTLEMLSNNQIKGLAPFQCFQMDDKLSMKYDITGKKTLREYFQGAVKRQQLFEILEMIADAVLTAEDYMLELSEYVFDTDQIYIDAAKRQLYLIVLPVRQEKSMLEDFLKELLIEITYDQTEDCSYVAALINLFRVPGSFSVDMLKEKIAQIKQESEKLKRQEQGIHLDVNKQEDNNIGSAAVLSQEVLQESDRSEHEREKTPCHSIIDRMVHDPERQHSLEILFSNEAENSPKKEKKGFFGKRDTEAPFEGEEKEIKPGLLEKIFGKKKKETEIVVDAEARFNGMVIPGVEIPESADLNTNQAAAQNKGYRLQEVAIPRQKPEMQWKPVEVGDFGATEYKVQDQVSDDEETTLMGQQTEKENTQFVLCRSNTGEVFPITGDVVRIGRNAAIVEICIAGNRLIGRVHAVLYVRDHQVFIQDNGSKNGTYIDGVPLNSEEQPVRLTHGMKIRLGDEELEFRIQG